MSYSLLLCAALAMTQAEPTKSPAAETASAPLVVVDCVADAEIRGSDIRLRDLAEVRCADPELAQRLLDISFGKRPAAGYNRVLSRQDVLLRLAGEGLRSERVELTGARQIVLHPVFVRVMPQDLLDAADPVLRAALDLEIDEDIEFEPSGKLGVLNVPPGRRSMDLTARLRDGTVHHAAAVIDVVILVDGVEFKLVRVPYDLRRFRPMLVTTEAIRRGTPLSEQNVAVRRTDAPSGTSPYLTDFESVIGKVAARDINAQSKLTNGSVMNPAVIFTGDQVHLVATSGRVQVATRAIALDDGAVGTRIAVRNLTAGKIVQATVRSRGLVVVEAMNGSVRVR